MKARTLSRWKGGCLEARAVTRGRVEFWRQGSNQRNGDV